MSRGFVFLVLAATLSACVSAEGRPKPAVAGVCPLQGGASPSQIDVFDGAPVEQVILAPDDAGAGANTYTVKDVYAQGRSVTIRCHYGQAVIDVKLARPVTACRYSDGDGHAQMACK